MPTFVNGLTLSNLFYREVVAPLMSELTPDLPFAAGLVGPGSDVQGFDTPISTDHDWGPRLYLFLPEERAQQCEAIKQALEARLPDAFMGYAVFYGVAEDGVSTVHSDTRRYSLLRVTTPHQWLQSLTGLNTLPPTTGQWLRLPDQVLREAVGGEIFRDDSGEISHIREALSFFPDDIWHYKMLCLWRECAEEAQFTGRTGDLGDALGSAVIAARQAQRLMRLCFLLERQYPPYSKWFGTAFSRLSLADQVSDSIAQLLTGSTWQQRVAAQGEIIQALLDAHNQLGITPSVKHRPAPYRQQFLTHDLEPIAEALTAILPPALKNTPPLGGLSDFTNITPAQRGSDARMLREWLNMT